MRTRLNHVARFAHLPTAVARVHEHRSRVTVSLKQLADLPLKPVQEVAGDGEPRDQRRDLEHRGGQSRPLLLGACPHDHTSEMMLTGVESRMNREWSHCRHRWRGPG